jgi:hypothetical protein
VTELADPRYVGTALTLQICLGFLLTTAPIALVGKLQGTVGWRWAFAAPAPGPALGVAAMLRLRSLPEGISDRAGAKVTAPRPLSPVSAALPGNRQRTPASNTPRRSLAVGV